MNRILRILKRVSFYLIPDALLSFMYSRIVGEYNELSAGEKDFFLHIKPYVHCIVDVGARTDTFYSNSSTDENNEYKVFMFEANPAFAKKLASLTQINKNSFVYNYAIGKEPGNLFYYYDSQSFVSKSNVGNISKFKSNSPIEVRTIDSFSETIPQIDFLKTDIEEMDFYALLGAKKSLAKVHFVQFELGLGMPHMGRKVENSDYWDLLEPNFELFVLRDDANPVWKAFETYPLLLKLTPEVKIVIKILQEIGVGFNVVGINRLIGIPESLIREIGNFNSINS